MPYGLGAEGSPYMESIMDAQSTWGALILMPYGPVVSLECQLSDTLWASAPIFPHLLYGTMGKGHPYPGVL